MAQSTIFFKTLSLWPSSKLILNNSFSKLQINVNSITSSARSRLKDLNIPEKPKRPSTPYARFIKENQSAIVKDHPDWKQSDVFKKCAEDWKVVSSDKKQRLSDMYKNEKQQYDKAILNYQSSLTIEQKEAIKDAELERKKSKESREKRKIYKETNKPKRPVVPYMLFLLEQGKMRNMALKDLMVEYKSKWANLQPKEKEKYHTQFLKEKQIYETQMKIWEDKMIAAGHLDLIRTKSQQEKKPSRIKKIKSDETQ